MRIDSAIITGSFSVNGDTFNDLGSYSTTGSNTFVGNQSIVGAVSASALTGSINFTNLTGVPTLVSGSEQIVGILSPLNSYTQSNDTINTTQNTRLSNLENKTGSLATTGSNTFIGNQTISGTVYIQNDLIVQGSSSLQNITASAVSIGTNIVNLNTANPSIRFAGLSIVDSGSIGGSGSFLYDSVQDEFIFVHRGAATAVTSSVILMGPQTYDSVGSETYPTINRIQKGTGNEHIVDSNISDTGTLVTINSPTSSFSGSVGIGITNPSYRLDVNGTFRIVTPNRSFFVTTNSYSISDGTLSSGIGMDGDGLYLGNVASSTGWGIGNAQLTIRSAGNVGIGITTPAGAHMLQIHNPTQNYVRMNMTNTATGTSNSDGLIFQQELGNSIIKNQENGYFAFGVNGSESNLFIAQGGNIGIGTNNPEQKLHIDGNTLIGAGTSNDFGQRFLQIRGSSGTAGNSAATLFLSQIWNGVSYPAIVEAQQGKVFGNAASDLVFKTSYFSGGVNTIERMRITDEGRVGIGSTTPPEPLSVSYAAHGLISQHRQSSGVGVGQNFFMKFNNDSGAAVNYAGIYADIQSNTTGAHRGRMLIQTANAGALANVLSLTSSGVQFGGSGSNLNNYEEGTWTPSIVGGGGGESTYPSHRAGWYTRVGRLVNVVWFVVITKNNMSGTLRMTGLPFTLINGSGVHYPQGTVLLDSLATTTNNITFQGGNASTSGDFIGGNGTTSQHVGLPISVLGNGTMECRGNLTYFTT